MHACGGPRLVAALLAAASRDQPAPAANSGSELTGLALEALARLSYHERARHDCEVAGEITLSKMPDAAAKLVLIIQKAMAGANAAGEPRSAANVPHEASAAASLLGIAGSQKDGPTTLGAGAAGARFCARARAAGGLRALLAALDASGDARDQRSISSCSLMLASAGLVLGWVGQRAETVGWNLAGREAELALTGVAAT
jgi:hypothetical protein